MKYYIVVFFLQLIFTLTDSPCLKTPPQVKEAFRAEDEAELLVPAVQSQADRPPETQVNNVHLTSTADKLSVVGGGQESEVKAQILAAGRASKLARVEAEAYADVQVRGRNSMMNVFVTMMRKVKLLMAYLC